MRTAAARGRVRPIPNAAAQVFAQLCTLEWGTRIIVIAWEFSCGNYTRKRKKVITFSLPVVLYSVKATVWVRRRHGPKDVLMGLKVDPSE